MQVLNSQQANLLQTERKILRDLQAALIDFSGQSADSRLISDAIDLLDQLFLLVVVGEFNSGKSAIINALLGHSIMPEGVTPTTGQIDILQYGPEFSRTPLNSHQHLITYPSELLKDISIVDTPGTNAIIREHEQITTHFIPRADLILFVTSADHPFTESERQFLMAIREWGKNILFLINKADILSTQASRDEVSQFVVNNAQMLIGFRPDVFLVSARVAQSQENNAWNESGMQALTEYIAEKLDQTGRLKLKLGNPVGAGLKIIRQVQELITARLLMLERDFQMLADVDAQLTAYEQDLQRDFKFRLADVENPLYELLLRGDNFIDRTLRMARVFDLFNKDHIRQEFEHEVIRDVPIKIEKQVLQVIDWMIEAQLDQWRSVTQHIAKRKQEHEAHMIGDLAGGFDMDRDRMIDALSRDARHVIDSFDKKLEARLIAEDAQAMITTSLAVEAGALGLGALVAVLATTAAADVTGLLSASLIAALGLFIIPARRRSAKKTLHDKIDTLRTHLTASLTKAFTAEFGRSRQLITEAIAPYTRFVRAESSKLHAAKNEFSNLQDALERIEIEIKSL